MCCNWLTIAVTAMGTLRSRHGLILSCDWTFKGKWVWYQGTIDISEAWLAVIVKMLRYRAHLRWRYQVQEIACHIRRQAISWTNTDLMFNNSKKSISQVFNRIYTLFNWLKYNHDNFRGWNTCKKLSDKHKHNNPCYFSHYFSIRVITIVKQYHKIVS